jgi:hypothetical protein
MSKTITDLKNANQTKRQLAPAIDALQRITPQAVGCAEAHEKIKLFGAWLQELASAASYVISRSQTIYDGRDKELINSACLRMFAIPQDIELNQKRIEHKISSHTIKVEEMRKQGFSPSEIEQITPFPQAEIDAHTRAITDLQKEKKSIEEFLSDAPVYDAGLLKGTALETFRQQDSAE